MKPQDGVTIRVAGQGAAAIEPLSVDLVSLPSSWLMTVVSRPGLLLLVLADVRAVAVVCRCTAHCTSDPRDMAEKRGPRLEGSFTVCTGGICGQDTQGGRSLVPCPSLAAPVPASASPTHKPDLPAYSPRPYPAGNCSNQRGREGRAPLLVSLVTSEPT